MVTLMRGSCPVTGDCRLVSSYNGFGGNNNRRGTESARTGRGRRSPNSGWTRAGNTGTLAPLVPPDSRPRHPYRYCPKEISMNSMISNEWAERSRVAAGPALAACWICETSRALLSSFSERHWLLIRGTHVPTRSKPVDNVDCWAAQLVLTWASSPCYTFALELAAIASFAFGAVRWHCSIVRSPRWIASGLKHINRLRVSRRKDCLECPLRPYHNCIRVTLCYAGHNKTVHAELRAASNLSSYVAWPATR